VDADPFWTLQQRRLGTTAEAVRDELVGYLAGVTSSRRLTAPPARYVASGGLRRLAKDELTGSQDEIDVGVKVQFSVRASPYPTLAVATADGGAIVFGSYVVDLLDRFTLGQATQNAARTRQFKQIPPGPVYAMRFRHLHRFALRVPAAGRAGQADLVAHAKSTTQLAWSRRPGDPLAVIMPPEVPTGRR
jgi:hypothetical protein